MICPACLTELDARGFSDSNHTLCAACNSTVYAVRDPYSPSRVFPAVSNSASLSVPSDVLKRKVVDQSPAGDPPRNMIIEIEECNALLIAQVESASDKVRQVTPRSLRKTAGAFRRDVLWVSLPIEVMERIRACD